LEAAVKVSKWGNSLAVRLPSALVARLGLKDGDEINVVGRGGMLEVERSDTETGRNKRLDELFQRVIDMPNKLPADYKFNRLDAYPTRRGGTGPDDDI
jgi:antitoxin MazE